MADAEEELSSVETHAIGSWPWNRLQAESAGRGWRNIHGSVATVNSWVGEVRPIRHHCIAYCVRHPAFLRRRIEGLPEEQMTLRPRQFFVIPARHNSEWDRRGRTEMLMIYVRQELLNALADELGSLGRNGRDVEVDLPLGTSDALLEQFALEVLGLLRSPEDGTTALYVESLARTAGIRLLRRGTSTLPPSPAQRPTQRAFSPRLRRIPTLIEATLGSNLSLERLAREADLPVSVFVRSFRHAYGTSPHQFVLNRRLERARTLLIATDLPISSIAIDTGFSSQSHFTTAFRRHTGLPPAAFRHGTSAEECGAVLEECLDRRRA